MIMIQKDTNIGFGNGNVLRVGRVKRGKFGRRLVQFPLAQIKFAEHTVAGWVVPKSGAGVTQCLLGHIRLALGKEHLSKVGTWGRVLRRESNSSLELLLRIGPAFLACVKS